MKHRPSIIWNISKEELQKLVDESSTFNEILTKLGYTNFEGNQRTLKNRLKFENINLEEIYKRCKQQKINRLKAQNKANYLKDEDIFIVNSKYSRYHLKNRIINKKLLEYKCRDCENIGIWNNKIISLQLEHINGINNDNRLENLCFLCPNCHSQTPTYGGKRNKIKKVIFLSKNKMCPECGNKKDIQAEKCRKCTQKFKITKEELEELITKYSYTKIGEMFGVSRAAVRSRCLVLNIDITKYINNNAE